MKKKIGLGLLALLVLAIAGFLYWGLTPLGPMVEAKGALQSTELVNVSQERWLVFKPVTEAPRAGLIFYPGGRVDYRSYAPYALDIAAQGFLVIITPMPLSLAVLDSNAAAGVIAAFPEIKTWAVGGHSLGGAMAATFAAKHPGAVQGVVFWAAYPAEGDSLAQIPIKVMSIYASEDGLATAAKIDASRALVPADTKWVLIDGGNHAQFGYYGAQGGDHPAKIDRDSQELRVVNYTAQFLDDLAANAQK